MNRSGTTEQHFRGTLTERDAKRHIPHVVEVPAAAVRVRLQLAFDPAEVAGHRNMICLTLFGPAGFRGAGHRHGNRHVVELGGDAATPGFLPGPLPAGRWLVQLDTHMVMPGATCHYELSAMFDHAVSDTADTIDTAQAASEGSVALHPARFDRIFDHRAGWYRGDLHGHTVHSDGSWTVADLVAAARNRGLDFVTLTDHNTTSGLTEMAGRAGDGLLTMGGLELTTFWGHALCLGGHGWRDWRVTRQGPEMTALAAQIGTAGELYVIAHPRTLGDPHCTGCRWLYPGLMPGTARLVEVWNGEWFGETGNRDRNEAALQLWYRWLNEGHRVVATAGSDVHGPGRQYESPSTGFTTVYADQLSQAAILRGVAAGHLYLGTGPQLGLTARGGAGGTVMMGDSQSIHDQSSATTLTASWDGVPESASLRLIAAGEPRETFPVDGAGRRTWSVAGSAAARWFVVELRAGDGAMLAVTNPIFFDGR